MMRILFLIFLIALFDSSNCLIHNRIKSKNVISTRIYMAGPGADFIPEDLPQVDYDKLPKIDSGMKDRLDNVLTTFAADATLKTVSYYMLEFRDEINQKWMMTFGNFSANAEGSLSNGKWYEYIESMIKMNKHEIQVVMQPPKSFLRGRSSPEGANVMIQYDHNIEPRKIAHKILTVREDVINELINDLGCVLLENNEAVRYATVKVGEGKEKAEKSRRQTRMAYEGGCTPLRDRNYYDLSVLLTNVAIDMIRTIHKENKDYQVFLDDFLTKLAKEDEKRNPLDRVLHETIAPRELIEEIYFLGLTEGVNSNEQNSVNILRLGKLLMDARLALAVEFTKFFKASNLEHRAYYRMITDNGGFKKLDLSGAPKYKLLDLDAERRKAEQAEKEKIENAEKQVLPKSNEVVEQQQINDEIISSDINIVSTSTIEGEEAYDWNKIDQSGPTLM